MFFEFNYTNLSIKLLVQFSEGIQVKLHVDFLDR